MSRLSCCALLCPKSPNFSVKMKYCDFYQVGQVLPPNLGHVLSHTLFMIPCITLNSHYRWLRSRLAIRARPDRYRRESLLKYALVHRYLRTSVLGPYVAVILYLVDDDDEWNVLSISQRLSRWHPVILRSVPPLTECAPIGDRPAPYMGQALSNEVSALIDASVEITEIQLTPSIHHLQLLPRVTNQ